MPDNTEPQTCGTCGAFDRYSHPGDDQGFCRRYAPRPVTIAASIRPVIVWPVVYVETWCAEWIARP